jgi:hypothetical protein
VETKVVKNGESVDASLAIKDAKGNQIALKKEGSKVAAGFETEAGTRAGIEVDGAAKKAAVSIEHDGTTFDAAVDGEAGTGEFGIKTKNGNEVRVKGGPGKKGAIGIKTEGGHEFNAEVDAEAQTGKFGVHTAGGTAVEGEFNAKNATGSFKAETQETTIFKAERKKVEGGPTTDAVTIGASKTGKNSVFKGELNETEKTGSFDLMTNADGTTALHGESKMVKNANGVDERVSALGICRDENGKSMVAGEYNHATGAMRVALGETADGAAFEFKHDAEETGLTLGKNSKGTLFQGAMKKDGTWSLDFCKDSKGNAAFGIAKDAKGDFSVTIAGKTLDLTSCAKVVNGVGNKLHLWSGDPVGDWVSGLENWTSDKLARASDIVSYIADKCVLKTPAQLEELTAAVEQSILDGSYLEYISCSGGTTIINSDLEVTGDLRCENIYTKEEANETFAKKADMTDLREEVYNDIIEDLADRIADLKAELLGAG